MTVEYLDLADYVAISAAVTGLEVDTVMKVANLEPLDRQPHHERGVGLHHLESAGLRSVPKGLEIPCVDGRLYPLSAAVAGGLGVWVRIHWFDVAGDGGAPTATS